MSDRVYVINTERGFYAGFAGYETGHLTFLFSLTLGSDKLKRTGPAEPGAATFADITDASLIARAMLRFGVVLQAEVMEL